MKSDFAPVRLLADPRVQMVVDPDDGIISSSIRDGRVWEPKITNALHSLLRPGDVFADMGAHIGYYTCLGASWVGNAGLVLSFEPNARSYAFLEQNVVLNDQRVHPDAGGQGPQADVRTFPLALWDCECLLPFSPVRSGNTGMARVIADDGTEDPFHVEGIRNVMGMRLDNVLAVFNEPLPDVIKIDVERAEARVLRGAPRALCHARAVVLEWAGTPKEPWSVRNKAESYALLKEAGFKSFVLIETGAELRPQDLLESQGDILALR